MITVKKEIKEIEVSLYVTEDGRVFDRLMDAQYHEELAERKRLASKMDKMFTCKAKFVPDIPLEIKKWYCPRTEEEASDLQKYFKSIEPSNPPRFKVKPNNFYAYYWLSEADIYIFLDFSEVKYKILEFLAYMQEQERLANKNE